MIVFRAEPLAEFWPDAEKIFPAHWRELALNQERIKIDVDYSKYEAMEKLGMTCFLTARQDGKLIAYLFAFLMTHFHYKSSGLMAYTDMFYVLPEYRKGLGMRLFSKWESLMKERGVIQIITSCKRHQNHQRFFEAMGWTWSDLTFVKVIG